MATRALLALACVVAALRAEAAIPTSCPVNGAASCYMGVLPGPTPVAAPIATVIAAENTRLTTPFATGPAGVCSNITFVCGVPLQLIYGVFPGAVASFASSCLDTSTPPVFRATGATYTAYGAFLQSDCSQLVYNFGLASANATMAAVLNLALPSMSVCNTANCNVPPPSPPPPPPSAAARAGLTLGAAAVAALAALA